VRIAGPGFDYFCLDWGNMTYMKPILYSFRRCPYAIRARYALAYAGIEWEHREVQLKDKPPAMLEISPKGTVPVLELPDGAILDESLDIMLWALGENDPEKWLTEQNQSQALEWVRANDEDFKPVLDGYKYPEGKALSQEGFRERGEQWLSQLESGLVDGFLLGAPSLADAALFPFIRQFRGVDIRWFESTPYPKLKSWLHFHVESGLFRAIMAKHLPFAFH
jgi:glutathione S-transferase